MRARVHILPAAALLLGSVAAPAAAMETSTRVRAAVAAGHDSNPLRVSGDRGGGGGFTELRLDFTLGVDTGEHTGLFLDLGGRQRWHVTDLSGADALTADVRVGLEWTPWRRQHKHVAILIGGSYGLQRLEFIDRATGRVFEVVEDPTPTPPLTRAIPDRLDVDQAGAFVHLRWKTGRRVRIFLDTAFVRSDYLDDFEGSNVLEPLDHDRWTVTPGVRLVLNRHARLTLSVTRSTADYTGRLARDLAGTRVAGVLNEYRYTTHRLSLDLLHGRNWETSFGVNTTARDDLYAGYYDYGGSSVFGFVKHAITPKASWQLFASFRELDYDNATVSNALDAEFRSSDASRFVGRLEYALNDSFLLFAEGGHQDANSNDPDYTYTRDWAMTGIRYRR